MTAKEDLEGTDETVEGVLPVGRTEKEVAAGNV